MYIRSGRDPYWTRSWFENVKGWKGWRVNLAKLPAYIPAPYWHEQACPLGYRGLIWRMRSNHRFFFLSVAGLNRASLAAAVKPPFALSHDLYFIPKHFSSGSVTRDVYVDGKPIRNFRLLLDRLWSQTERCGAIVAYRLSSLLYLQRTVAWK